MIILLLLLIPAFVILFYNWRALKITIEPVDLPKDLEAYLKERETLVSHLRPDCEKRILWANRKNSQTEFSIIYLHSFTGSPRELHPLIEDLGKKLKANIFYQRLDGHGQGKDDLETVTLQQWTNNTWEAWEIGRRIGRKIILVSTSTGSALATWLCGQVENIHSAIMLSPNFMPKNHLIKWLILPGTLKLLEKIKGHYARHKIVTKAIEQYFTIIYPRKAWLPMFRACLLANTIHHEKIATPLMLLYTEHDTLISTASIKSIYSRWGSAQKKLVNLCETKKHLFAGNLFAPEKTGEVQSLIENFIQEL
ncbi:MAG: hypothetical protein JXR70_19570 [Spirochaetales bacterium]|nr:hypothetical protein [Spirochaetales bacterium]